MDTMLSPDDTLSTETSNERLVIKKYLAEGSQGEVYLASLGGNDVAVKWYRPEWIRFDVALQQRLRETSRRNPPSDRFLWPQDLVFAKNDAGFGYVMPYKEPRFCDFDLVIAEQIRPSLRTLATSGLQAAEGYQRLHAEGLCYVDVSLRQHRARSNYPAMSAFATAIMLTLTAGGTSARFPGPRDSWRRKSYSL